MMLAQVYENLLHKQGPTKPVLAEIDTAAVIRTSISKDGTHIGFVVFADHSLLIIHKEGTPARLGTSSRDLTDDPETELLLGLHAARALKETQHEQH